MFVDTSGWLAYFSARDRHHAEAERLLRHAIAHRIQLLTTNLVLAELQRLLLHRAGIRPATVALELIDKSPTVEVRFPDAKLHREAQRWLTKLSDQVITYTDAASFAVMAASKCKVALTFDRDFVIAGYTPWML